MPNNNILPEMINISCNCAFTTELHTIIKNKLTEYELNVFHRWLQIIDREKQIDINNAKHTARRY